MLRDILLEKINAVPFEPFVVKLNNGDRHDMFYPQNLFVDQDALHVLSPDQNWAIIPFHAIASIECQFDDYQGKLAEYEGR